MSHSGYFHYYDQYGNFRPEGRGYSTGSRGYYGQPNDYYIGQEYGPVPDRNYYNYNQEPYRPYYLPNHDQSYVIPQYQRQANALKRVARMDGGPPQKRQNMNQANSKRENIFDFFKNNICSVLHKAMAKEWPAPKQSTPKVNSTFLEKNKSKIEALFKEQQNKEQDNYKELFDLITNMGHQSPEKQTAFYDKILNDIVQSLMPELMGSYKDLIIKCMQHDILSLAGQELLKYEPPIRDLSIIISTNPRHGLKKITVIQFLSRFKYSALQSLNGGQYYCVKMADSDQYYNILKKDNTTRGNFKFSVKPGEKTTFTDYINFKKAVFSFNDKQNTNKNDTNKTTTNFTTAKSAPNKTTINNVPNKTTSINNVPNKTTTTNNVPNKTTTTNNVPNKTTTNNNTANNGPNKTTTNNVPNKTTNNNVSNKTINNNIPNKTPTSDVTNKTTTSDVTNKTSNDITTANNVPNKTPSSNVINKTTTTNEAPNKTPTSDVKNKTTNNNVPNKTTNNNLPNKTAVNNAPNKTTFNNAPNKTTINIATASNDRNKTNTTKVNLNPLNSTMINIIEECKESLHKFLLNDSLEIIEPYIPFIDLTGDD